MHPRQILLLCCLCATRLAVANAPLSACKQAELDGQTTYMCDGFTVRRCQRDCAQLKTVWLEVLKKRVAARNLVTDVIALRNQKAELPAERTELRAAAGQSVSGVFIWSKLPEGGGVACELARADIAAELRCQRQMIALLSDDAPQAAGSAKRMLSVEALLKQASDAFDALEYDQASDLLLSVIARPDATREQLIRAHLIAGICHRTMKRDTEARMSFLWVLRHDPETKLSRKEFPPKIVDFFELVRSEAKALGPSADEIPRFFGRALTLEGDVKVVGNDDAARVTGPDALLTWQTFASPMQAIADVRQTAEAMTQLSGGSGTTRHVECLIGAVANRCSLVMLPTDDVTSLYLLGFTTLSGRTVSVHCAWVGDARQVPPLCAPAIQLR